ncbi:MAG: hypothetical protein ACUVQN_05170 [Caldisericia bacterium]
MKFLAFLGQMVLENYDQDVTFDKEDTLEMVLNTFKNKKILTLHSEEATLEDNQKLLRIK